MAEQQYHVRWHVPPILLLRPEEARALMMREIGTTVHGIVEDLASEARQRMPVNTGILRASIGTRVSVGQSASALVHGEVFTGQQAPYAVYVEEGTRPHFPPRAPIELWTQRVLGDRKLWFLVARAISRRGTRAHHMFRDAWAKVSPTIQPRLQVTMDRIGRLLVGGS